MQPESTADAELKERLIALTRDLILIPGTASRVDDRDRCFEFIRNHVEALAGIRLQVHRCRGVPSLVATADGAPCPAVLLCGHLDVINHPDSSVYRSRVIHGRIVGPGAGDMKGPLAILLELFRDVHTRHPGRSLGLAITSDEENGGDCGLRYLVEDRGLRCGVAIIPDGGSPGEVVVEEKGIAQIAVKCVGRSAHAARPWLVRNPLEHLMTRLVALQDHFRTLASGEDHWHPTCAVTVMHAPNDSNNRIPAEAEAVLDVRFPPPFSSQEMIRLVVEHLGPGVESRLLLAAEPARLSPDPMYLRVAEEVTGHTPLLIREPGGSDGRFVCRHGIPVIMSRPLVGEVHGEDEWVDIESMVTLYRVFETYLRRKLGF